MPVSYVPPGGEFGGEPNVREQWVGGSYNRELVDIGQQEPATFEDIFDALDNIGTETVTFAAFGTYEVYDFDDTWYAANIDIYSFNGVLEDYWNRWQAGEYDSEGEAITAMSKFVMQVDGEVNDVIGFSVAEHRPSGRADIGT